MTNEDLITYFQGLGHTVGTLEAPSSAGIAYLVIRNFEVHTGSHAGQRFDVAIQRSTATPYVPPPAIHVRPHAVPMGSASSQASPLGAEWQYLSRVLRVAPVKSQDVV